MEEQADTEPGGRPRVSFSNRWFPSKAALLWVDPHEFERPGLAAQWLAEAGFTDLEALSIRDWPRPKDEPHIQETWISDPAYLACGVKKL